MNNSQNVFDDILQAVGRTPMVRINKLFADSSVEVWAKCEFLNPGGSVKDRIGVRMLVEARKSGRVKPGDTIIEATSGNTGIGLAMACAVLGHPLYIALPMKMSMEKQRTMEALGATIIRTRTEAAKDDPDSLFGVAKQLNKDIPNSHILDQYGNPDNALAHYFGTGTEIFEQMDGRMDYLVGGVGTGGTISGAAKFLKEKIPNVKIVGADPEGSILGGGEPGKPYLVEGIGYDFIPDALDLSLIDQWIKTNDADAFRWARRCIREEGLLVGGSSGSALIAVDKVISQCNGGERIVVILPDSIRNYMTKFLDDDWLAEKGISLEVEHQLT
jgi:cysteine synthase A